MRRRLARKLQATYLLVILVFLLVAGFYLHRTVRRFYIDQKASDLAARASLILRQAGPPGPGPAQDAAARKLSEAAGARVTLIGPTGQVWADSEEASSTMENHFGRPEVQQALGEPRGVSIRRSDTTGVEYLYVALPVRDKEALRGFIRLALPLTELDAALRTLRNEFLLAFFVASLIALIISGAFSRSLTRSIESIAQFARQLARGRLGERLPVASRDEVGQLAVQLNAMAAELERTIQLMEQEKSRVESILQSMGDAILLLDGRGEVLSANPAATVLFGVSEAGLVGRSLTEVFRNPRMDELFDAARQKERPARGPVSLTTPRPIELEVSVVPMGEQPAEGAEPRFLVEAHNITHIKRLEKMRVDFVANVSHELRSPLTAIKGFIETLQAGAITDLPAAERFLEVVASQVDRLTRLLDDLMTLSNIELGKVKLDRRAVDVADVVEECFATLEPKAANGSITLTAEGMERVAPVEADRDRLMQILLNLVDNGIKFTPPGGSVIIRARPVPAAEGAGRPMVELVVADTGIGIPKRDLPRISERFYRVDKARSRELGGTGLGLAIVKHLVLAHDGTFSIESEVSRGTSVCVRLPEAGSL